MVCLKMRLVAPNYLGYKGCYAITEAAFGKYKNVIK